MKFLFKLLVFVIVIWGIVFFVKNYIGAKAVSDVIEQKKQEAIQELKDKTKAATDQVIQEQADKLKKSVTIN